MGSDDDILTVDWSLDLCVLVFIGFIPLVLEDPLAEAHFRVIDHSEFIDQLATLNTLSETTKLNENMLTLQMLQAAELVGREVEAVGPNGEHVEGTVTEVWFIDSEPWLTIDDEAVVALEYVVRIA